MVELFTILTALIVWDLTKIFIESLFYPADKPKEVKFKYDFREFVYNKLNEEDCV